MIFLRNFTMFMSLLVLLAACAQETMPTGGEKDETPPQPVLMNPAPLGTFFETNSFEITFDEYIQVDDFTSQLLISPPLKQNADYKMRGRKLTVTWSEPLLDSTTYQFNFGEAVKDLNEGNVNDNLLYVFSTGHYIDSMKVSGKVYDAFTNEPVPKAKVMLYRQFSDTLPYTSPPDFLAVTNALGEFTARYLPADTFMLFALKEESSNYKYDGPPEQIAFLDYHVLSAAEDTAFTHIFALFLEADTSQYLKSAKGKDYGYYETVFNVPVENPAIRFVDDALKLEFESFNLLTTNGDTLKSWVKIDQESELEEITVYTDDGRAFLDTNFWYIETDPKYREKAKLSMSMSATGGRLDANKPVSLRFNHPLEMADSTLIVLLEDSIEIAPRAMKLGSFQRSFNIEYPFSRERSYTLIANAGAFKDIYGNYSDSLGQSFGLHPEDYYGSLTVNVMLPDTLKEGHFILELKDGSQATVASVKLKYGEVVSFGKMAPGKYSLLGIFDENNDGKWNTGNYKEEIQPERQVSYSEELNVRSNWEMDVDWIPITPFHEAE